MQRIVLTAYANPYAGGIRALDADGRASAFVPKYMRHDERIGALRDPNLSRELKAEVYVATGSAETIIIQDFSELAYYRNAFKEGALVAGDSVTASQVGTSFDDPELVIEIAKDSAIREWTSTYGREPECAKAHAQEERTE